MAREARKESKTGYYHIMMRGNNRECIFKEEEDKRYFKEILRAAAMEEGLGVAAWCLMDTHVHLVVKGSQEVLFKAFKKINIRFAMRYNIQNNRVGHVFQDRYKSECIEDDSYLLSAVRYVHNNPVKAKMPDAGSGYPWSSYEEYWGASKVVSEEQKKMILAYFSGDIKAFKNFHGQEDDMEHLEIKEDLERYRLERGQEIISSYCESLGIVNDHEMIKKLGKQDQLILELLKTSKLSHRKISEILEIPRSKIHQVSRRLGK